MKNARELGWQVDDADLAGASFDALTHEAELALIQLLGTYPRMLAAAAQAREPHRVAFYLMDLAAAFHGFGSRQEELNYGLFRKMTRPVAWRGWRSFAPLHSLYAQVLTLSATPQDELR